MNIQVKATSDKYTLSFHEVLNEIFLPMDGIREKTSKMECS